jgi:hypothetical protein
LGQSRKKLCSNETNPIQIRVTAENPVTDKQRKVPAQTVLPAEVNVVVPLVQEEVDAVGNHDRPIPVHAAFDQ